MTTGGNIAYQLRSGLVRESTFISALQALLNASRNQYIWSIRSLTEPYNYEDWLPTVERVTGFELRLERPNPHYRGDEIAEQLLEGIRLEYARLSGAELPGEGVDVDSTIFIQALDHVLHDYGRASLRALDRQGSESVWVKLRNQVGSVLARQRRQAIGGDDAPTEVIRDALYDPPRLGDAILLGDSDETSGT